MFVCTQIRNNKLDEWAECLFLYAVWQQQQDWMSQKTSHCLPMRRRIVFSRTSWQKVSWLFRKKPVFSIYSFSLGNLRNESCVLHPVTRNMFSLGLTPFVSICEESGLLMLLLLFFPVLSSALLFLVTLSASFRLRIMCPSSDLKGKELLLFPLWGDCTLLVSVPQLPSHTKSSDRVPVQFSGSTVLRGKLGWEGLYLPSVPVKWQWHENCSHRGERWNDNGRHQSSTVEKNWGEWALESP